MDIDPRHSLQGQKDGLCRQKLSDPLLIRCVRTCQRILVIDVQLIGTFGPVSVILIRNLASMGKRRVNQKLSCFLIKDPFHRPYPDPVMGT